MQIDSRKIHVQCLENREVLKDGSVRYVNYKAQDDIKQLLELKPSWGTNYNLSVNLPRLREVDKVVIIARTSVNCYRVIISTTNGTDLVNCKTYDEVNQAIVKSLAK